MRKGRTAALPALLFLALLGVYLANGDFLPASDTVPNALLPVAILEHGAVTFEPTETPLMFVWELRTPAGPQTWRIANWDSLIGGRSVQELYRAGLLRPDGAPYYLVEGGSTGRYAGAFGLGPGLAALPVFSILRCVSPGFARHPKAIWFAAKFSASALAAGSAVFIYLIALGFVGPGASMLLAFVYGLGSCTWSISSQALWQHAPNQFFVSMGCFGLLRRKESLWFAALAGLSCGAAVWCRPTSVVLVAAAGVWLLIADRRAALVYVLAGLPLAVALAAYNRHYLGSPWAFGQAQASYALSLQKTGMAGVWQGSILEGAAGLLLSPSRGLFVFSPVFLFSIFGLALAPRAKQASFFLTVGAAFLGILLIQSKWYDWWGGWSYGYRPIVDTTPLLAILILPAWSRIMKRRSGRLLFAALSAWSVGVQLPGAFAFDLSGWNKKAAPGSSGAATVWQDVDRPEYRSRLWSIRDNEIAYYGSHFADSRRSREEAVAAWNGPAQ